MARRWSAEAISSEKWCSWWLSCRDAELSAMIDQITDLSLNFTRDGLTGVLCGDGFLAVKYVFS